MGETIVEFGKEFYSASTPTQINLFIINNNLSLVNKRWKKLFYRLVYQLIYLLGRKYLELAISFLVSQSAYKNEGSYCKL